ncbi:MAG: ECF transporter S component [Nostocoides sp.]
MNNSAHDSMNDNADRHRHTGVVNAGNATATTTATAGTTSRPGSVLASRPLMGWRTVDILTITFLGAAFGIAYWAWALAYAAPSTVLANIFPPLQGAVAAPWFVAGVVGGLIVRRPGAAFLCELVAAVVEMVPGSSWGAATLISGILQGAGAELAFALAAYGSFGIGTALLAGALSAPFEAVYEWFVYWTDWGWGYQLSYGVILTVAGAAIAGGLGWLITKALASAGALNAFPPGQEQLAVRVQ